MDSKQKTIPFEEHDPLKLSRLAKNRISETRDKKKRLKVLESIAKLDALWTQNVLLDALVDPNEEIRNYIVTKLAQKENLDFNLLYNRLSRPPWNIKNEVLKILGLRKNPRSAKHIEIVINDSNDEVRKTAAEVLGNIGDEFARSLLVKLARDQNPFVRKAAEKSLDETINLKFL